ncbi:hypothetical protein [Sphingomonas pituitosa]|uniref:hypothetical protein n=1 Tax=Sphingomonas pituitosa TaxID=99597 RepID=UPI00082D51CE|nr:hypothetical protein [Sphingomonas pituitosa]
MKIAKLAASPTAFLHLKGPDGAYLYEGKEPMGIEMYGPGTPEAAAVESAQSARAIKRMQDNNNKISLPPAEDQRAEKAADLSALTVGFQHIEYDAADGTPLTGKALFLAVYSDPSLGWIKEQADKFRDDWGNFMPRSPKT